MRQSGTCGRSTARLTGDREAHLRGCQGFPATSQHLEILANSPLFKFLSRAEVSLSFPFCHNLQLVYLIKHCKSCRRSTLEVIHHRLLLPAAGLVHRRSRRLPGDQETRHWHSRALHPGGRQHRGPHSQAVKPQGVERGGGSHRQPAFPTRIRAGARAAPPLASLCLPQPLRATKPTQGQGCISCNQWASSVCQALLQS